MTQTFDQSTRSEAPIRADELTALRGFLDYHRDTFRWKCSGLTQEQLARPHAPSTMTLGGMMKHLALTEVGWFGQTLAGDDYPEPFAGVDWDAAPDWEWRTARDGRGFFSLRWIVLHLIEEYARHNGHADLIRESIDGETGE